VHIAFAVGRCLRLREARQTGVVNAAKFVVEIGGSGSRGRRWRSDIGIPVEPGPG